MTENERLYFFWLILAAVVFGYLLV